MISTTVRVAIAGVGLATVAALAGCGTQTPEEESGGAIAVDASDEACEVAQTDAEAAGHCSRAGSSTRPSTATAAPRPRWPCWTRSRG